MSSEAEEFQLIRKNGHFQLCQRVKFECTWSTVTTEVGEESSKWWHLRGIVKGGNISCLRYIPCDIGCLKGSGVPYILPPYSVFFVMKDYMRNLKNVTIVLGVAAWECWCLVDHQRGYLNAWGASQL